MSSDSNRKFLRHGLIGVICLASASLTGTGWARDVGGGSQPEPWSSTAYELGFTDWHQLYAIAMQESRMAFNDGARPWPWTLNSPVTGPLRFDNKEDAVRKIEEILGQGVENIDVGLMQINLRWHGQRVDYNVSDLIDPYTNIRVAAEILRETMGQAKGDYAKAVALYHSYDPERGRRYANSVMRQLRLVRAAY